MEPNKTYSQLEVYARAIKSNAIAGRVSNVVYLRERICEEARNKRNELNQERDRLMSRGAQREELQEVISKRDYYIEILEQYCTASRYYRALVDFALRKSKE